MNRLITFISAFTIVVFSFIGTAYAQSYGELVALADSAYDAKSYQLSGEYFDKAFLIKKDNYSDLYNAACSWSLAGNANKSLKYIESALRNGWDDFTLMEFDKDLDKIRNDVVYKGLTKKYKGDSIVTYMDIITDLLNNDNVRYEGKIINPLNYVASSHKRRNLDDILQFFDAEVHFKLTPDSLINFESKSLAFINCRGQELGIEYLKLKKLTIEDYPNTEVKDWLVIHNSKFDQLNISLYNEEYIRIWLVEAEEMVADIENIESINISNSKITSGIRCMGTPEVGFHYVPSEGIYILVH